MLFFPLNIEEKNSIPLFIEANIAFFYYKGTHQSKNTISIFVSILKISIIEMGWRCSKDQFFHTFTTLCLQYIITTQRVLGCFGFYFLTTKVILYYWVTLVRYQCPHVWKSKCFYGFTCQKAIGSLVLFSLYINHLMIMRNDNYYLIINVLRNQYFPDKNVNKIAWAMSQQPRL